MRPKVWYFAFGISWNSLCEWYDLWWILSETRYTGANLYLHLHPKKNLTTLFSSYMQGEPLLVTSIGLYYVILPFVGVILQDNSFIFVIYRGRLKNSWFSGDVHLATSYGSTFGVCDFWILIPNQNLFLQCCPVLKYIQSYASIYQKKSIKNLSVIQRCLTNSKPFQPNICINSRWPCFSAQQKLDHRPPSPSSRKLTVKDKVSSPPVASSQMSNGHGSRVVGFFVRLGRRLSRFAQAQKATALWSCVDHSDSRVVQTDSKK